MDITEYARTLLSDGSDASVKTWAYEAQRMVAWHAICLVPLQGDLLDDQRNGFWQMLSNALSHIDPREPLVVPISVRERLLNSHDHQLSQLVEERTTLNSAA